MHDSVEWKKTRRLYQIKQSRV